MPTGTFRAFGFKRRWMVLLATASLSALILVSCAEEKEEQMNQPIIAEESTFFSIASVEPGASYTTFSDGDLWPVAWAEDDALYSANGDGIGFGYESGGEWSDIVMNKITGSPWNNDVEGERLAAGDEIGRIWGDPERYNRKPTGIVAVGGDLYLGVQDLNKDEASGHIFNEAPAASIYKSTDKGKTWTAGAQSPMFKDHTFTTVMFLDYGQEGADNTFDDYVYAYGLDNNWRDSFSDIVEDPTKLYLARMKKESIQDVSAWEFYAGNLQGKAKWTKPGDLQAKRPVLQDERRLYTDRLTPGLGNLSVVSQGSIVYNRPLDRYLYTSWTEFTFEFYEAPKPWGPWKRFLSVDFGEYPWVDKKAGGYATIIPSKYISADGREMWVGSNTFVGGVKNYNFSLRKLKVVPFVKTEPDNGNSGVNLALPANSQDVAPLSRAMYEGELSRLNDGDRENAEDSRNGERKPEDWWGYAWSRAYHINKVVYSAGDAYEGTGGWFDRVRVQVRQNFKWVDVRNIRTTPSYPGNESANRNTYEFVFDDTWGDGVRIIGKPGGDEVYTSIAELEGYYAE